MPISHTSPANRVRLDSAEHSGPFGTNHLCDVCGTRVSVPAFKLVVRDGPFSNADHPVERNFFRCDACGFISADQFDAAQYERYYSSLNLSYHEQHDADLTRYGKVVNLLQSQRAVRVLDWGCGNGEMLSKLGTNVEKFGVELSAAASAEAAKNGVKILSLADLASDLLIGNFDAITLIDVVEHARQLKELRQTVARLLRRGGLFIVMTGCSDSPSARRLGPYWYYLHYAEHISFFNERSMRAWLKPEFENISIYPITHHTIRLYDKIKSWTRFVPVWVSSRLSRKSSGALPQAASNRRPYGCLRQPAGVNPVLCLPFPFRVRTRLLSEDA